ncbi:putative branched-chain-amino-acid aminotransferase-like protein [Hapsidospora chrysogenum ATCC 11550]|uniref:Putative branched-chain-amino-acid aminotransferase-like protein n=1 Tax=Hapsidospora chrysogenum (strain ATCC 11550 / CBS 779.69 / DSM 880 / IAM 14645 / JCM 23072 / IMI 49137) TaxID=857340 RepID=A0A086TH70_HAPC1|nr:putative branched-chain-amino-acid aminotransferase-like protein [Hapsidospora chrysogenum ATCC 11550]
MAGFPPPPVNTIDWSNVGFKVREVNGHIESTWSKTTGEWTPLRFVADPYMRIHGMAPALNYGQQAYEGLKAFRTPGDKSIAIFRPDRNAVRLQHSADVVSMPRVPVDMFLHACRAAVALNAEFVPPHETGAAMYIRPQIYGSSAQLGLSPPDEYTFCVFVIPTGVYHGTHPVRALILDEFDRAAPHGTGNAKVGGNYAPVLRWSDAARNDGFGITLHLDSARHEEVDEFSTSGFIGAIVDGEDDVTLVVPDSQCIIDSVTSDSILQIARSFGWKVEKRPIKYQELARFSEVMAAGTAAALVPIRSITRRKAAGQGLPADSPRVSKEESDGGETVTFLPASQEEAGPVCLKLLTQLKGIQLGKVADEFGWRVEIAEGDREVEGARDVRNEQSGKQTPTVDEIE